MSDDYTKAAADFWGKQPSPHAPELTNAEYPIAVKMASKFKFGGHASPQEAQAFWAEYQSMNKSLVERGKDPLAPEEAGHLLDQMAPMSFAYHGRPPTMKEIVRLRDEHPKAIRQYFEELPDRHYPDLSAGAMVKALASAHPWANQHLNRDPLKNEARYLHHSGEAPAEYYSRLAKPKEEAPQPQPPGQQNVPPQARPNS